jgi:hypothetical protein
MGDFAGYVLGSDSYDQGLHTWTNQPDPFEKSRAIAEERIELPQELVARRWKATRSGHLLTSETLFKVNVEPGEDDEEGWMCEPVVDEEVVKREAAAYEARMTEFLAARTGNGWGSRACCRPVGDFRGACRRIDSQFESAFRRRVQTPAMEIALPIPANRDIQNVLAGGTMLAVSCAHGGPGSGPEPTMRQAPTRENSP